MRKYLFIMVQKGYPGAESEALKRRRLLAMM